VSTFLPDVDAADRLAAGFAAAARLDAGALRGRVTGRTRFLTAVETRGTAVSRAGSPTVEPIEPSAPPRRPAHRPSRRNAVIDGAIALFATNAVNEVTVHDVANAVEMTPAAVYYHFASKEQILLEGMERFRDELLAEVRSAMPERGDVDGVHRLVEHVLTWASRHRVPATVYFVNSLGLNLLVEALRRETRLELVWLLRDAVSASRGKLARAEAAVIAVGLVSLIETSVASMLNQDATHRSLGNRRFIAETGRLADRITGVSLAF
jgi:AcrR family transcriptional regulator